MLELLMEALRVDVPRMPEAAQVTATSGLLREPAAASCASLIYWLCRRRPRWRAAAARVAPGEYVRDKAAELAANTDASDYGCKLPASWQK